MSYLISCRGTMIGSVYSIEKSPIVLGRRSDCDLSQIFAGDTAVSRRHTQITHAAGVYFVEDLGSSNGTRLNGRRIAERVKLTHGDLLTIGATEFTFSSTAPQDNVQELTRIAPSPDRVALDPSNGSEVIASVPVSLQKPSQTNSHDTARRLSALVCLLSRLGQTLEIDATLRQLLQGLFDVFPNADRGYVGLKSAVNGIVQPCAVQFRSGHPSETFRTSQTIIERVMSTGDAIISVDAQIDERFQASRSISNIRSFMCAPLFDGDGRPQGVVQIESLDESSPFSRDDLEILASIAPHASLALNYARIHAKALERQALEHDLKLAREVQLGLLPHGPPHVDGYDFFTFYEAAHEVGGDFYDYVRLPAGRTAVVVADVAGKGVSAALLAAKAAAELKYLLFRESAAADAVACMNDALCDSEVSNRFITLALAVLDPRLHEVRLVNAGHLAPLLRKADGATIEVGAEARGMAVGMFPDRAYGSATVRIDPGDCLVLFTDGVTEATNLQSDLYGLERLCDQVRASPTGAEALAKSVVLDIQRFADGQQQSDDICLICIHRS